MTALSPATLTPAKCLTGDPDSESVLLCLPHAGASADVFRSWAPAVAGRAALWSVDYPGRRSNSGESWRAIGDLADTVADRFAGRPGVRLFGHSLGGILAYEVALRLEESGTRPERVVVSAVPAPHVRADRRPPRDRTARAEQILEASGMDPVLLADPDFHLYTRSLLASDLDVLDEHRPSRRPLSCPLRALAALGDEICGVAEMTAWREYSTDYRGFAYFPGSHMFVFHKVDRAVGECFG